MALLLFIAGSVEVLLRAERLRSKGWRFVWPAALTTIGVLFLVYTQHARSRDVGVIVHR